MNGPEYRVMISSTVILVDTIAAEDPKAVSDDLVRQELINYDVYAEMSLDSRTSKDKARKLVQALTHKVLSNPSENFSKFLAVVKKRNMHRCQPVTIKNRDKLHEKVGFLV